MYVASRSTESLSVIVLVFKCINGNENEKGTSVLKVRHVISVKRN
jgi:hypothetical protein